MPKGHCIATQKGCYITALDSCHLVQCILNLFNCVPNGNDLFCSLIWNLNVKLFFNSHDDLENGTSLMALLLLLLLIIDLANSSRIRSFAKNREELINVGLSFLLEGRMDPNTLFSVLRINKILGLRGFVEST